MKEQYSDIIDMPHHTSPTRTRMPVIDRAAQFAPFAALVGYDAAIKETGRLTDEKIELGEDEVLVLNEKFRWLRDNITNHPHVTLTYFKQDERKQGGEYVTVTGKVKRIKEFGKIIVMEERFEIKMDDIVEVNV